MSRERRKEREEREDKREERRETTEDRREKKIKDKREERRGKREERGGKRRPLKFLEGTPRVPRESPPPHPLPPFSIIKSWGGCDQRTPWTYQNGVF